MALSDTTSNDYLLFLVHGNKDTACIKLLIYTQLQQGLNDAHFSIFISTCINNSRTSNWKAQKLK